MKTCYNVQGNLANLLSAINAGNLSMEGAGLLSYFLYYWVDVTSGAWAFTDAGYPITVRTPFSGNPTITFDGNTLQFEKLTVQTMTGAQDSKATIVCFPNSDDPNVAQTVQTFFSACSSGLFDGAFVWILRIIISQPQNVVGMVKEYGGWIGQIKATRDKITIELNSIFQQMNLRLPKRTYSNACTHGLYDAGCTVSKPAWTNTFTVNGQDANYPVQIVWASGYPAYRAAGTFNLGKVQFTSGLNTGLVRGIKSDMGTAFWLTAALPNIPAIGDTFSASAGCDKTLATCINKFNNFPNFNGFPFIPQEQIFF